MFGVGMFTDFLFDSNTRTDYFEIYIKVSFEALKNRDTKGIYSGIKNVVGVDIPWYEPSNPDLVLYADNFEPPGELAKQVISLIPNITTRGEQK